MGILSNLIEQKNNIDTQRKQAAIQGLQTALTNPDASPETREWALQGIASLADEHFGQGGKGSGGSRGGQGVQGKPGIGQLFKNVLSGLVSPYTGSQSVKQGIRQIDKARPQGPMLLTPEQKESQGYQAELRAAAVADKIAAARARQAAQLKREDNQQVYDTEFDRLIKAGVEPRRAAEEANALAAGRTVPAEREPTERDIAFQAYADRIGKKVEALTAGDKIAAIRESRAEEKPPAKETEADIDFKAYADKHGKKVEDLTAADKIQAKRDAKEAERLPQRPPLQSGVGGSVPDIKPGTPDYKVAQDLSTGKLTFPEFRGLFSYSRDATKRAAIYQKATELNPDFDAAAFERGFKFSSNVSVQKQLASLENVKSGVADLLRLSEAASRTRAPILNRALIAGGISVGGKRYSDFNTARTAFADELSGALGYGSATDMSREMGFNMTDPSLSPEQFRSAIQTVIVPFIERKRRSLTDQMGPYGGSQQGGEIARPQNKADFDALATGTVYIDPADGKKYRKP